MPNPAAAAQAEKAGDSGLAADLRQALARGEVSLVYQPIVDAKTRALAGVEALARWNCPSRGFVPPDRFIPVAEAAGLIEAITDFVLRRAFGELAPLFARHPGLKLSINLAAHEVSPSRIGELLALLAAADSLAPDRLQFEITERTLLGDRDDVHAALMALTTSGATVAIDDFGTGYSSLSYLDGYPIHCLKIDKSFVQRLDSSAPTRKLTEAILLMARALEVKTVAEGVETIEQLAFLIGKGCRYIQGYLFSRPLPVRALEGFVEKFRFPTDLLDAALWPTHLALPRVLADNKEKALRLFVEHVPAAVAIFDTAMRYVAASPRWLETYEIAGTDAIGRCHYDVVPETPHQWRAVHARCLAGAAERGEDDCFVRPDGRREWTSWEVQPMTNPVGDVVGIIIFSQRITARKLAEQQQQESEQRLADFLDTSSDWIWELDADLRFVMNSGSWYGQPRSVNIGRRPWELPGTEPGQDDVMRAHVADLTARRPFRNFVYGRRTVAGELCWSEISGNPIFADGSFRGYRGTARDVTGRQRTEAALRQKVVQLEMTGEMAGVGSWHWDATGKASTWSDEIFRIVGRDPAAMRLDDDSRYDVFHPDDRQPQKDLMRAAILARQPFQRRARVLRPDGSMRDIRIAARPQIAADGRLLGFVGTLHDITEQVAITAELTRNAEENRVFRTIIEALPDQVFAKDREGRFTAANAATLAAYGMSAEDLIGKTDYDLRDKESADRFWHAEQAMMREDRTCRFDHSMDVAGGPPRALSSIKVPLRDADGRVVGLVGCDRDVTEERRAQIEARASAWRHDLYRQGIELLPDLFFVKDLEHRFLVANHGLAAQVGVASAADVIGRTDDDFHAPSLAHGYREEEAAVMAGGMVKLVEEQARRPDGTLGWFSTMKAPLRDAAGKVVGVVGNGRDITEEKVAKEALERRNEEQRRLAQTLATARQEAEHARDMLSEAAMVMSDGFALFDPNDRLILCNGRFSRGLGASTEDIVGLTFAELMRLPGVRAGHALDDAGFEAWLALRTASHRAADGTPFEVQNHEVWVQVQERRTKDGSIVLSRTDITHLKTAQEDLRQLASRDALTGLSNRRDFVEQASRRIGTGEWATVVLFDIDHFKRINDRYGHPAGDETLRQLARTCAGLLRPTDLLARWGGEEFILLLLSDEPPLAGSKVTLQMVERLRSGIADLTVRSGRNRIRTTASFGVASCAGSSCVLEALIERADEAMYRAKRAGRNRIELAVPAPGILAGA